VFISKEHKANTIKYKIFGITIWKIKKRSKGSYGMKTILQEYSGINFDNNKLEIQHGWTPLNGAIPNDLKKQDIKVIFAWNERYKQDWDKNSKIPCYILGAPFVHYRQMNNIVQNTNAKGTLAFPAHNTKTLKAEYDIDKYCEALRSLPEEFHPITISLHMVDIDTYHLDKEYEKRGFKTVCAGLDVQRPFYEVFYDNLRKYKYTTSNVPGSYTFYSVEMDIPFFILGELPYSDNSNGKDKNTEAGIGNITYYTYGKKAYELFYNKDKCKITKEQKDFVVSELGLNNCITKEKLISVLRNL